MAFTVSNQQYVSGTVRLKLFKGHAQVVGRKSEHSLYRHELATYEEGDQYDSSAALGFIKIHGLGQTTQAKHQMLRGEGGHRLELPSIMPPSRSGSTAPEQPPAPETPSILMDGPTAVAAHGSAGPLTRELSLVRMFSSTPAGDHFATFRRPPDRP